MGRLAASVHVVTAHHAGRDYGLTMTAVCSLSADPPSMLLSVAAGSQTLAPLLQSGRLCVNLLGPGHASIAERFSGRDACARDDRFAAGDWSRGAGQPAVLHGATAAIACHVVQAHRIATHCVIACAVDEVILGDASVPLLYANRGFARLISEIDS